MFLILHRSTAQRRFLVTLVVIILSALSGESLYAAIVDFEFEGRMTPAEVDGMAARLFEYDPLPRAEYAIDVYWIHYTTIDVDGSPAVITAQVFIPVTIRPSMAADGAFVAGFSQGGHAAFAAADMRQSYAPEVELAGVIGYGSTTDLRALFLDFTVSAPLVIYVNSKQYGVNHFNPEVMLKKKRAATLEHGVTTQCIGGIQSYYPWSARDLFTPEFYAALSEDTLESEFPEIHRIMQANSTGLSGHGIPALIAQGVNDPVVIEPHQDEFVDRLCEAGSSVLYLKYGALRHDTRQASFEQVRQWMMELLQYDVSPSACTRLEIPRE